MTSITVTNPATGAALGSVQDTTPAEAAALVASAHTGFQTWRQSSPRHRAEVLMKAFTQMVDQKERLAGIISQENGKSLHDAAAEVGLASYVYAGDLQQALSIGECLEAGMAGVNRGIVSDPSAPFGGVKQSGIGREGGRFGIEEFTEPQYLSVAWD